MPELKSIIYNLALKLHSSTIQTTKHMAIMAKLAFTDSFFQPCQTMKVHYRSCGASERH